MKIGGKTEAKYVHEKPGIHTGNILWSLRDRGTSYYSVSAHAMRAGKFPPSHPVCPCGSGNSDDQSQIGDSDSIQQFRARGYWASCFPEGDGITMRCLNGQDEATAVKDIEECLGLVILRNPGDQRPKRGRR